MRVMSEKECVIPYLHNRHKYMYTQKSNIHKKLPLQLKYYLCVKIKSWKNAFRKKKEQTLPESFNSL